MKTTNKVLIVAAVLVGMGAFLAWPTDAQAGWGVSVRYGGPSYYRRAYYPPPAAYYCPPPT